MYVLNMLLHLNVCTCIKVNLYMQLMLWCLNDRNSTINGGKLLSKGKAWSYCRCGLGDIWIEFRLMKWSYACQVQRKMHKYILTMLVCRCVLKIFRHLHAGQTKTWTGTYSKTWCGLTHPLEWIWWHKEHILCVWMMQWVGLGWNIVPMLRQFVICVVIVLWFQVVRTWLPRLVINKMMEV